MASMSAPAESATSRLYTGVSGLDDILFGGLMKSHMYLIEGESGTGKTTLGLQFVLEGKRVGDRCLYVTLSESKADLEAAALSHGWSLDDIPIAEFVPDEASLSEEERYTVFHPAEVELATTIKKLLAEIERVAPERLVIDSLSEFRMLALDPLRYRRQLLALKQFFASRNTTVLLLDDHTWNHEDQQVLSIVHGVIRLTRIQRSYGVTRRHLEVVKMRSAAFREGYHDYTLDHRGVVVYPRLIAAEHGKDFPDEQLSSNLPALDALFTGGIERGTSTLVFGPAGVGKSSIGMQYAWAAAKRGERAVVYHFDETLRTAKKRARTLGIQLDAEIENQYLCLEQMDAAELSPGEFVWKIRCEVEENQTRVIVIDSLNGYLLSMPGEADLALHMHELLEFLNQKGVTTFLILTQQTLLGEGTGDIDISYLADNVLIMRYFEADASVRRAISVLKKRSGAHENTIRELRFGQAGIQLGEPLAGFKGVLSGTPDFIQAPEVKPIEP
jgi:circadian clock protein KaiC